MIRTCLMVLLALAIVAPAQAVVYTGASCDGDTIAVEVFISSAANTGVTGLNLEWAVAETPGQRTMVLVQPIPVAATNDDQRFTVRVAAPMTETLLVYFTYFTNAAGERVPGSDPGCSWFSAYAICGEIFMFRARIFDFRPAFGMDFDYCDASYQGCSGFDPDLTQAPDWASFVNTGRLVNAYGLPGAVQNPPCAMPGSGCPTVTRLEFEDDPAGCTALDARGVTWGALKGAYR